VHQGAKAVPGEDVIPTDSLKRAEDLVHQTAQLLQARFTNPVVELGVDLVFDHDMKPWLLEVNSRPSGRFQTLSATNPSRFRALADQAVVRPLQRLAALCS